MDVSILDARPALPVGLRNPHTVLPVKQFPVDREALRIPPGTLLVRHHRLNVPWRIRATVPGDVATAAPGLSRLLLGAGGEVAGLCRIWCCGDQPRRRLPQGGYYLKLFFRQHCRPALLSTLRFRFRRGEIWHRRPLPQCPQPNLRRR